MSDTSLLYMNFIGNEEYLKQLRSFLFKSLGLKKLEKFKSLHAFKNNTKIYNIITKINKSSKNSDDELKDKSAYITDIDYISNYNRYSKRLLVTCEVKGINYYAIKQFKEILKYVIDNTENKQYKKDIKVVFMLENDIQNIYVSNDYSHKFYPKYILKYRITYLLNNWDETEFEDSHEAFNKKQLLDYISYRFAKKFGYATSIQTVRNYLEEYCKKYQHHESDYIEVFESTRADSLGIEDFKSKRILKINKKKG